MAFLDKARPGPTQPVYVLSGDEDFLRRQCRETIIARVLGEADPEFALSVYTGEGLDLSTVRNDLDTLPFLAPARLVIVENADKFISVHRSALEKYVEKPSKVGVLVLDAKSFPETTNLAKKLPDGAKLVCKAPSEAKVPEWCLAWSKAKFGVTMELDAARLLLERVGPQLGLLNSEIAKLATAMPEGTKTIRPELVDQYVERSREANVFQILDAVGEGKPQRALQLLNEALEDGTEPLAVLGALGFQLRKLAAVERHMKDGHSAGSAMDAAGVAKWPQARISTERQLKALGRRRLSRLTELLIETNLGLKGGCPLPPELQLERLVVNLAAPRA